VSKTKYSAFKVLKEALTGHKGWEPAWRDAEPKADGYDVIIVGGGGHGLATAYYLAKNHGITNIAVLEKGWIGGGNVGRNTTIIRSNYLLPGNEPFYEMSMQLWENLEQDLNYNAMVSQRGIMNLIHSDAQRDAFMRRGNAMLFADAGCEYLNKKEVKERYPFLDMDNARFPIQGALAQPRGGTVRHDAVAWGYARGASDLGVDIIQNCEVTGFNIENGKCLGVQTTKGDIKAGRVGVCVAGSSSRVMAKAGINLPIESHVLQAFVTEGLKPVMDNVITFGAGHFYCSQLTKAASSLAVISMHTTPMRNVVTYLLWKMCVLAVWRLCLWLVVLDCCVCGAASWTCLWTAHRLLTRLTFKNCSLMAVGVMAALRQHLPVVIAMRIYWQPTSLMKLQQLSV